MGILRVYYIIYIIREIFFIVKKRHSFDINKIPTPRIVIFNK